MRLEESKKMRVAIAAILLILGIIIELTVGEGLYANILFILAWIIAGLDIFYQAFLNLKGKMLLAEHFLMSIATIGAVSITEYKEAAMVMVLFQIGELLEDRAVDKSRQSIMDLMDIAAPVAFRLEGDERVKIDPDEIELGDLLEVRAGERLPVDGKVVKGASYLNVAALTGESLPLYVEEGAEVLSGSINGDGRLIIEASKSASDSTAMRIIELLEEATENQAQTESFITRFAKVYTPIVVLAALIIAFIPPLFVEGAVFQDWFKRGLIFLVVSCPCAFVVSVPMSFVMGLGRASKLGILVKGGSVIEMAEKVKSLVTDKTGTLTQGKFAVTKVDFAQGHKHKSILSLANAMELGSSHPIAEAIKSYAKAYELEKVEFDRIENIAGKGIEASLGAEKFILGNMKYLNDYISDFSDDDLGDSSKIYLAQVEPKKNYLGAFAIEDRIKDESKESLEKLKSLGIEEIVMLTGDEEKVASKVAGQLGITEYKAGLLPQDKLSWVKARMEANRDKGKIAFVGDGLNDAPVIALSDLGISMGGIGSDAAIEASDVVIVNDDLRSISTFFDLSKYTMKIARQNIFLSLFIKLGFLIISVFGLTQMWMAVFADVGVTLLAIANSFRLYFYKNSK